MNKKFSTKWVQFPHFPLNILQERSVVIMFRKDELVEIEKKIKELENKRKTILDEAKKEEEEKRKAKLAEKKEREKEVQDAYDVFMKKLEAFEKDYGNVSVKFSGSFKSF